MSALLFVIAVSSPLDQWYDFVEPHSVLAFFEVSVFDRSECSDLESLWMEEVWISPSTPCVITAAVLGDKSRNFLAAFGAWCMPAAAPFNSHGLLERDAVAVFDKLPSCHEDDGHP